MLSVQARFRPRGFISEDLLGKGDGDASAAFEGLIDALQAIEVPNLRWRAVARQH